MSDQDLETLDKAISELYRLYDEVREAARPPKPRRDRRRLLAQLKIINFDIFAMEEIDNDLEAGDVTIAPPSEEDVKTIKNALTDVGKHVAKDQTWSAAHGIVMTALDGAKAIRSNMATRQT